MANHLKKAAQYLISLGLMIIFLYWAFRGIDPAALWNSIDDLSIVWVGGIVLTALVTLMLRGWRWVVLMRPFAPQVSILDASLALAICYATNIFIPRSGEFVRAVSLKWTRGASISSVLATVVVERILDLIWLIVFLGVSLLLLRSRINQAFPWIEPLSIMALAGCVLALACLALISIYRDQALPLVKSLLSRISPRLAEKVTDLLETFLHGLQVLHSPVAYFEIILSSMLLNLGYVLIIYQAFAGFGFTEFFGLGFGAALVIMAISSVGVIVPTPGAAGPYHVFFGKALILLFGLPQTAAMACATAVHAIATLTYLSLGGPVFLWQRYTKGRDGSGLDGGRTCEGRQSLKSSY